MMHDAGRPLHRYHDVAFKAERSSMRRANIIVSMRIAASRPRIAIILAIAFTRNQCMSQVIEVPLGASATKQMVIKKSKK